MGVFPMCMSVVHFSAWCPQRLDKVSNPLELLLQMFVSHLWVLGIYPKVLSRSDRR